jgi:L-rhamnose mutarotase
MSRTAREVVLKYFGLTLNLKEDADTIAAYRQYHRGVWPEVENALRQAGIIQMKIFLLGSRLFMYMETRDEYEATKAAAAYLTDPKVVKWEELMKQMQEPVPEGKPGELWAQMEPVYELH